MKGFKNFLRNLRTAGQGPEVEAKASPAPRTRPFGWGSALLKPPLNRGSGKRFGPLVLLLPWLLMVAGSQLFSVRVAQANAINIKKFGAKEGCDATVAIQKAANYLTDGSTLIIDGNYTVSDTIYINKGNYITITGPGIISITKPGIDVFVVKMNYVTFENLTFISCNGSKSVGDIISYKAVEAGCIRNCTFKWHDGNAAVRKVGGWKFEVLNNKFLGIVGGLGHAAISLADVNASIVSGNILDDVVHGIQLLRCSSSNVTSNYIEVIGKDQFGMGIQVIWSGYGNNVSGNVIETIGERGIVWGILWEADSNNPIEHGTCGLNNINNVHWGIALDTSNLFQSGTGPTGITLTGNTIRKCHSGIIITHKSNENIATSNALEECEIAFHIRSSDYNIINNNIIKNSGSAVEMIAEDGVPCIGNIIGNNIVRP